MCPFQTLGLQRTDELKFVTVKHSFLKIAMQHHPDTSKAVTKEEQELDKEKFVAARQAFEMIVEGPNGIAILKSETDEYDEAASEDDLSFWFQQETGLAMPYMDAATMREVAKVTESMGGEFGGLDRDGGMWTLARMVSQRVKEGGDANEILQLEAGKIRDRNIDGVLRRRRRRR
jgi:DnaJ-class molecular chaperone